MQKPYIDPQLLKKYLDNQCNDSEKEMVEQWYAQIIGIPNYLDTIPDNDRRRIKKETFSYISQTLGLGKPKSLPFMFSRWTTLLAAASVVILLTLYLTYMGKVTSDNPVQMAQRERQTNPSEITFTNTNSQIVQHVLPDGTKIWLHHDANITYPKAFSGSTREVSFSGEGFFEVTPDKSKPFYIHSGDLQVKVLGTSFNVKAKANADIYEVSVVTGIVEVSSINTTNPQAELLLKPSEQALYNPRSNQITYSKKVGQTKKEIYEPIDIIFDNTPLNEVVSKLETRFNVKIHFLNKKLANCGMTADFEQQPLLTILDMLCASLGANYTLSDQTILLDGPSCD
ncbi:ferric-dicitrate binding protein FerR (iron transport regulator) [Dyadobacter jejuensis]|uniref:Ferric-dicitrate binding protein FerR (Iron transport regulator) n=1 Tax=Dyadobacter jejuensis TaxID=1082580 RepID=A0A316AGB8_9BACT|nr:FecR family protein [Dyadobacter jejuensis]PWJ56836.1 ferric-dicitrate binding protein FerR (iron transport regulator) [Dyadobacter jejuensis]